MKSSEIRQAFFDYFSKHGHTIVPSGSLVPGNDPTLLFTNAGMVPFKDVFLGVESRSYSRAVSAQCCVRAGGKHNDLENVGYTARHHTFFEMLGNFSFGDYFKREAIRYAWVFLTDVLQLPEDRLWVTVYQDDDETADIWLNEMGVSPKRFSRCGEKDNFWSMGDTGPCGPCTEIFYDHGPDIAGGPPGSPDADGDRYIEIWNLVFMQFNRDKDGQLHPLPKPSVDTGMGLERIAAVVQGVHTNYDTDMFKHVIAAIVKQIPNVSLPHPSLNVVADHIRACTFLIADGVVPAHEGRGYVLRRIIRRAVRHGHTLGLPSPFFYQLVLPVVEVMGEAYPNLVSQKAHIERVLLDEERQFSRTLEQGLRLLREAITELSTNEIPGDVAFKLYDTYGFPLDLTADIAREHGLSVDITGFEESMQQQRLLSQSASQFHADYATPQMITAASSFRGYEEEALQSSIVALLCDGKPTEAITVGTKALLVLDETPFYAESGGQVADKGTISTQTGIFRVDNVQTVGQAIAHYGEVINGVIRASDVVMAEIDHDFRAAVRLNHTATHLLHAALKSVLGNTVQQKGSLVTASRARFDFSHHEALTAAQIQDVEALVNNEIRANHEVTTTLMSIDDAKKTGAMALFGEKYNDVVRVLTMSDFSKELCGGTHANRTGDIGLFKIVSEAGIASGVRRIEMVTGHYALQWVNEQGDTLQQVALQLKTAPSSVSTRLAELLQEAKQAEKELDRLKKQLATQSSRSLLAEVQRVGDVRLLVKKLENADGAALRILLDQLKSSLDNAVVVLVGVLADNMTVVAGVSQSLLGRVPSAAVFVQHLCGKGGGRPDMAQGGGVIPKDLDEKMAAIASMIM